MTQPECDTVGSMPASRSRIAAAWRSTCAVTCCGSATGTWLRRSLGGGRLCARSRPGSVGGGCVSGTLRPSGRRATRRASSATLRRGFGKRRDPLLASFAVADDVCAGAEVNVAAVKADRFGDPNPVSDDEEAKRDPAARSRSTDWGLHRALTRRVRKATIAVRNVWTVWPAPARWCPHARGGGMRRSERASGTTRSSVAGAHAFCERARDGPGTGDERCRYR